MNNIEHRLCRTIRSKVDVETYNFTPYRFWYMVHNNIRKKVPDRHRLHVIIIDLLYRGF